MKKLLLTSVSLVGLLAGCSNNTNAVDSEKINVITSYYPYQLITEELGGDFVNVESIYPTDSDAHSYEMTPMQTMDLQDADLVIITNVEEDAKIYNSLREDANVVIVDSEEEEHAEDEDEEHIHGSHSWLSPHRGEEAVSAISDALIDLDATNKLTYTENESKLTSKLEDLDSIYAEFGANQSKPIVATHDAYSALEEDYGIEFITLYGAHHDDEPTTKDVIDAVDTIKELQIKTIFVEQGDKSNPVMRQIADEAAVNVDTLYTLETESSHKSFTSIADFYDYNLKMFELGQE